MKISYSFLLLTLLLQSCKKEKKIIESYPSIHIANPKTIALDTNQLKTWAYMDMVTDTIPGIGLDKVYTDLIPDKTGDTITVAIIDMEVDIEHEDLKDNIWHNTKEIPDNNRDDDDNGYTDDIHGWNFLGNLKGENNVYVNYEYTRILKTYDSLFNNKEIDTILETNRKIYQTYKRAQKKYKERLDFANNEVKNANYILSTYTNAKKVLMPYFPEKDYSLVKLDSLKNSIGKSDKEIMDYLVILTDFLTYNLNEKWTLENKRVADERIDKLLNKYYNDRSITGDDPNNIEDIAYGNPYVSMNADFLDHGTLVAGVIAANRTNAIGAKGVTDLVKIMPLCISAYGDEHDKDMALAIRYAVANGAKIINISSSKEFSLHQDWVTAAIRYAAEKDVLIVTSAGNDGYDLDEPDIYNYPDDTDAQGNEVVDTFIKVSSSGYTLDKNLKHISSSYGKKEVDIFAPGEEIYTTNPSNTYGSNNGTSFAAPIVAGVAALIRSYYPSLSAAEVKDILMKSGTAYHIDIEIEQEDGSKKLVPFSELSKSGKIVNAYNAMILAEKLVKAK